MLISNASSKENFMINGNQIYTTQEPPIIRFKCTNLHRKSENAQH